MSLEDTRLSVQDGRLSSRIVCVHCGYVQHCEVPACVSCCGCHFQQVPFLGDQVIPPGTATKLGRAQGCDPRALMEFPAPLLRTVLHVLTLWAGCLSSLSSRLTHGAAFSPPLLQGTVVCVWIIAKPRWDDAPQLRPGPHLPPQERLTVCEALSACGGLSVPGGALCTICQRPRLITGLLFHAPGWGSTAFCPKIQSEHTTRALASTCFGYRGPIRMEGIVLTSLRRRHDCNEAAQPPMFPAPRLPLDTDPYLVVSSPLVTGGAELLGQDARLMDSLSELTLLTMNCGGAARKATDIIAIMSDLSVDIAFLQELWEGFAKEDLQGMGYKVFYDGVAE